MRVKYEYILVIFAAIFLLIYSIAPLSSPLKTNLPDEQANYAFANLYCSTGELSYSDELNETAHGIIRVSRNTVYHDSKIIPSRFTGFPVIAGTAGTLAPQLIRFVLPFLAIIGALFLYLLVKDLFNIKTALLSSCLLFVTAPYWYWSSHTMMDTAAAVVMLIVSLRYFFKLLETGGAKYYLLSGLFFGLSLFIRPDYIILFSIPLLIILLWNRRRIKRTYIGLSVFSFMVALCPLFILNKELYGSFLTTGQHVMHGWEGISQVIPIPSFSLANIIVNSSHLIGLTPLFFALGLLGLLYCAKRRVQPQYTILVVACLLVTVFYFLSGPVRAGSPTDLRSPQLRYILPIYPLLMPLVSYYILSLGSKFIRILLILCLVITSILIVLPQMNSELRESQSYAQLANEIADATEPDAVIFLLDIRYDKVIFPERRMGLVSELHEEHRAQTLCEILIDLSETNVLVYVFKAGSSCINYGTFVKELSSRGYVLTETGVVSLYGIQLLKEATVK